MENNHTQFNNEKNIIEVETSKANQQIEKLIENLESLKKELLGVDIKNFGKDIEATVKNITDCGMQIEKMKKDLSVVFGEKSIFNQTYKSVSKFAEKIKDVYLKESKDPIGIEEALGAIFSKFQGIDAIVAGAALAFTSFFGMLQDGFSWLNEIVMLLGIAIVSVGAIILGIPAGIAAAVAGVIAAIATIAVVVKENWLEIRGFFSGLIADVVEIWGPVAMWFYENVIEPIVNFVSGLWMRVMQIIEGAWIFIQAMWMYIQTMCLNIFAFFMSILLSQ